MKYCCRCMNTMGDNDEVCPRCGMEQRVYAAPPHILSVGTVVNGRYLIGGIIGEGGFGITYIGLDTLLKYRVAVKEFYPNGMVTRNCSVSTDVQTIRSGNSQDFFYKARENFLREAQTLALFNEEPSIVSVKDFFAANNTVYIVMEYLEGITLKRHLSQLGDRMPWRGAVELLMPVLTALKKIHAKGLIHRDISPDNIMLVKGSVKILDFGAAREYTDEKSLSVMLKHGYAPFEQYKRHGNQGAWTDIYAFCATLYKCVTGETPLQATDRMDEDTLKMPSELGIEVGKVFEDVLRRGLAVRVKERIQTDDELLAGLQAALADTESVVPQKNIYNIGDNTGVSETYRSLTNSSVSEPVTENVTPIDEKTPKVPVPEPVKPKSTEPLKQQAPIPEPLKLPSPEPVEPKAFIPEPSKPRSFVPVKKKNMAVIAAAAGIVIAVGGGIFAVSRLNSPDSEPAGTTTVADEYVTEKITDSSAVSVTDTETTTTQKKKEIMIELADESTSSSSTDSESTAPVTPEKTAKIIGSGQCGDDVTWTLDDKNTLTISGNGDIDQYAGEYEKPWYDDANNIEKLVIEKGIRSVGDYAFCRLENLKSVTIPDTVKSIGYSSFWGCNSLTEVTIPDSVTIIGEYAFSSCINLKSAVIPDSVTSVSDSAFSFCRNLTIKCKKDSYIELYAKRANINYESI